MRHHFNNKIALVVLILCCLSGNHIAAQQPKAADPIIINGNNNETTKAEWDLLAERVVDSQLIVAIARLGKGESSSILNRRRLHTMRNYLETTRAIPKHRIITAVGEPVRGVGRIEVYLCDKLFRVFTLERNRNFAREQ
jgi:hypothetical protein